MAPKTALDYRPDYAVPPGETLQETLEGLGISQAQLAHRTGRPIKTINEIVKGKASITSETAIQLERALGVPASFWSNRERLYREALARQREATTLHGQVRWLKNFPIGAMVEFKWIRGYVDKVEQLKELLTFFGVASPDQWKEVWAREQAQFRKPARFRSDKGALAVWLRKGELDAQKIACVPFDLIKFQASLRQIRKLTLQPPEIFQPKLTQLCAACGVAVVFVPELPKTRASGATRWLSARKALIQLSLRYKTDDHLWFTFFHEACHVVRHRKNTIFLERGVRNRSNADEEEADRFAEELLVPSGKFSPFVRNSDFSTGSIRRLANEIDIAPGVVVGRLQHEGLLPYSHCNGLKRTFNWAE